jgi:hypothetical protein
LYIYSKRLKDLYFRWGALYRIITSLPSADAVAAVAGS